MKLLALSAQGFRGIEQADLTFADRTAFMGPNGCGKSTVIDAVSLILGRSKLVPTLSERDLRVPPA